MDHQRTVRCMQELDKKDNKMEEEKYKSLEECRRISPYCSPEAVRKCTESCWFTKVRLYNGRGDETQNFVTNEKMIIEIEYESEEEGIPINIAFGMVTPEGTAIYRTNTKMENQEMIASKKKGTLTC